MGPGLLGSALDGGELEGGNGWADAKEVVSFRFVRGVVAEGGGGGGGGGEEEGEPFQAEFAHQIFGDDEEVEGWKPGEVSVQILIDEATFQERVRVEVGGERVKETASKGGKRDDPLGLVRDSFSLGLPDCSESFLEEKGVDTSEMTVLESYSVGGETWETVATPLGPSAPPSVLRLHKRIEPLTLFFIDGASAIEADTDGRWTLLLSVQRGGGGAGGGGGEANTDNKRISKIAAFMTVYNFFAWPDSSRLRLSQMLVFPPFQRKGHGAAMVRAFHSLARLKNSVDLVVEDPTDVLLLLCVSLDVKRISQGEEGEFVIDAVKKAIQACQGSDGDRAWKLLVPPKQAIAKVREVFGINRWQFRRCWEVLMIRHAKKMEETSCPNVLKRVHYMIKQRLHAENFAKTTTEDGKEKRVVDTETGFVMHVARKIKPSGGPQEKRARLEERMGGAGAAQPVEDASKQEEVAAERRKMIEELLEGILVGYDKIASAA